MPPGPPGSGSIQYIERLRPIASTADLEALAQDDEAPVPALKGWRRRTFGEQALKLKAGRLALAVDGRQGVRLIELEG